jgi:hypothetical protein
VVVELSAREWGGRKIDGGLMDSGYMTERCYTACLLAGERGIEIFPSKGGTEKFTSKPVRTTDIIIGGQTYRDSLILYSDGDFKRMLYIDNIKEGRTPWFIPQNIGRDYLEEMVRERLVPVKTARGYEENVWKRSGANHYADAEKLCLVWFWAR